MALGGGALRWRFGWSFWREVPLPMELIGRPMSLEPLQKNEKKCENVQNLIVLEQKHSNFNVFWFLKNHIFWFHEFWKIKKNQKIWFAEKSKNFKIWILFSKTINFWSFSMKKIILFFKFCARFVVVEVETPNFPNCCFCFWTPTIKKDEECVKMIKKLWNLMILEEQNSNFDVFLMFPKIIL